VVHPGRLPSIRWFSLFADVPAERLDAAAAFWSEVTGAHLGTPSGDGGEYVPLVPGEGDRYLWLQQVGRSTGGWHPDLHVPDVAAAAAEAQTAGATVVRPGDQLTTLTTPAGQPFCLVEEESGRARSRPAPQQWPTGRSFVDQICFDIPAAAFDAECDFWARLTGWDRLGHADDLPEFDRLGVPPHLPLLFLLQRLGEDDTQGARAHADLSADARTDEVARHEALGAEVVRQTDGWTSLRDPAGLIYCVTDRRPGTTIT
jgi:predicted enzyme related to lactoylglutathione lyase